MKTKTNFTTNDILDFDDYDDFDLEVILKSLKNYAKYQMKHNNKKNATSANKIATQITKAMYNSSTMGYCPFTVIKPNYVNLILNALNYGKKHVMMHVSAGKRSLFLNNIKKLTKYQQFIQNKVNLNAVLTYQHQKDASLE